MFNHLVKTDESVDKLPLLLVPLPRICATGLTDAKKYKTISQEWSIGDSFKNIPLLLSLYNLHCMIDELFIFKKMFITLEQVSVARENTNLKDF